ncbi:MAG: ribosome assembly RNA-binding protein YhbY [Anaeromyxobacteraceae bacterium]
MAPSQNPKKRSLMPSSPLRRRLRSAGHHLSPVVQVGKEGVTEAVLRQVDQALTDHELVKVKVGTETPEDRFGSAEALLAGSEGAQLAQILGRTMLLYRRHPKKPRFEPLPAQATPPAPRTPPRAVTRATRPTRPERPERTERTTRRTGRPERTTRRTERTTRTERTERTERTTRRTGRPERRTERPSGPRRPTRR